jgi:hypothetical protein
MEGPLKLTTVLLIILLAAVAQAQTWTESFLYFPQPPPCDVWPLSGVIIDSQGNLYLTGYDGVASVLYKVTPNNVIEALYTFPPTEGTWGMVTRDSANNLYGTGWGATGNFVYKVTSKGKETTLYAFASGKGPIGPLRLDSAGNIYGYSGYSPYIIFKLTAKGKFSTIHTFLSGNVPNDSLIIDSAGNFYGTATGGTLGYGFVFKMAPDFKYSVLYNFTGGSDGGSPTGKLTQNSAGLMYGTTKFGGDLTDQACLADNQYGFAGCGTVFSVTSTGTLSTLYSFTGGTDGYEPVGSVTLDSAGNLYGITLNEGNSSYDTSSTFQLTPTGVEETIGGASAANPGLAINKTNSVFGSTTGNCDIGNNGIYELTKN